jgi:hypothetical protein
VAGFGAELGAMVVFGGYATGSLALPPGVLLALLAVPISLIAVVVRRWLPPLGDHPSTG